MVGVRVVVVLSIAVLLIGGDAAIRRHLVPVAVVLVLACGYAFAVAAHPRWELRGRRTAWLVTAADATLALLAVALSGAAASPAVAILLLVVTAAAIRLPLRPTVLLAVTLGVAYLAIALLVDPGSVPLGERVRQGTWWAGYLVLTGVLGASLSRLVEREREAGIAARVEAMAEHAAAEEERDLRQRLLESYQSQQDGLAVLLHEFRTPVASLRALARGLANPQSPIRFADRAASTRLVAEHANHLSDMLDALADVAASRRPSFSTGRVRAVELRALLLASADAAGLRPPRLRLRLDDEEQTVTLDSQRLRRVLTNLLENAARHGEGHPVDIEAGVHDNRLHVRILDRGPGIDPADLDRLTGKYTGTGPNRGTAGLGLWIVEQIVQALGGRLDFSQRAGGGLIARFDVPVG
ncbi:HAMP domain-containing histidine kinase [Amycolatopsis acidiphila]|uniref:histidine kinase n=2 Tax=Amycolatopsis acidiphila TaxID=715473 RepID=A0A558ALG7_9PSEU|nr:HAMP domain-containing histidine kinase [Amycolatopsis acidiphila]